MHLLHRLSSKNHLQNKAAYNGKRIVKGELIGEVLFAGERGAPQGLSAGQRRWAAGQAEQMITALAAREYDIVGSLDELAVSLAAGADAQPPSQQEVLEAALGLAGILNSSGISAFLCLVVMGLAVTWRILA